jgi:hypothetical protein
MKEMEEQSLETFKPKYSLGRITNKYLILEIYSFAYLTKEEAMYRLFRNQRSSRKLLIEEYYKFIDLLPQSLEYLEVDFKKLE